jgi:hypothetical protein
MEQLQCQVEGMPCNPARRKRNTELETDLLSRIYPCQTRGLKHIQALHGSYLRLNLYWLQLMRNLNMF